MSEKSIPVTRIANKDQAQALANFLWNEKERHLDDVANCYEDLVTLAEEWGVEPVLERLFVKP
jgi:hypothetical protein